jgi:hypothetical protein
MVQDALNESRRIKAELTQKIAAANKATLAQRVRSEGMEIEYSSDEDYLRISVGPPRVSVSLTLPDDIYAVVLFDPDTYKINAVEVPFFMERIEETQSKVEFWKMFVDFIKDGRTSVYIPPLNQFERTERAFEELVYT